MSESQLGGLAAEDRYKATRAEAHEVSEIYWDLGPNARAVLIGIARRLQVGQERYNDDFSDGRKDRWLTEARDEALDLVVYLERESQLRSAEAVKAPDPELPGPDGLLPDGTAWLPPKGAKVRIVVLQPDTINDHRVCAVFEVSRAEYSDIPRLGGEDRTWVWVIDLRGSNSWCRVVPA